MKIAIVYDSRTGTTEAAAEAMGAMLSEGEHECTVESVAVADVGRVAQADVILVGSWTQGLFVVLQHPTAATMEFIGRLGDLSGKKAAVFCTYKLATGKLLPTMAEALRAKGAEVAGEFKFRGAKPTEDFRAFAGRLAEAA